MLEVSVFPLKSYASGVARASVALIDVIASSKTAATAGFCDKYSNTEASKTRSNAGMPVFTL
jgi:hypothetical protein